MDDRIREAIAQDVPRIVEMGARSLAEGPYRDHIGKPDAAGALALQIMGAENGHILLYEKAGQVVGLLAFLVYPHYFTGEPTGHEVMWWIEPEHRHSLAAVALFRAAERMAREMGAVKMQFTAPTEAVERMYRLMGYTKIEVGYQRDLCKPRFS